MHSRTIVVTTLAFTLFVVLTYGIITPAIAQRQRMSADERVKHLTEQLSLTKAQADSVRIVYQAAEKERDRIFQSHADDRSAMREEMMKAMGQVDLKIESLLTAEQKKGYEIIKKERPQMGGPPHEQSQKHGEKKPGSEKE